MKSIAAPYQLSDPVNARILAVSEDKIQGFQREPLHEIARQTGVELHTVMERIRSMLQEGTTGVSGQGNAAGVTNLAQERSKVAWQVPAELT